MTGWIVLDESDEPEMLMFDMFKGDHSQGEVIFFSEGFGREPKLEWKPLGDTTYTFDLEVIAFDRVETKALEGVIKTSLRVPDFLDSVLRSQVTVPLIEEARSANEEFYREVLEHAQQEYFTGLPHWLDSRADLHYMSDQLVSFSILDSYYTGGLHSKEIVVGRTFLIAGEAEEWLDYEGLFVDREHSEQFVIEYCFNDLTAREDGNYLAAGKLDKLELEDVSYWVLQPDALVVLFSPMEINTYATGVVEVRIPREVISEHIKPEILSAWK